MPQNYKRNYLRFQDQDEEEDELKKFNTLMRERPRGAGSPLFIPAEGMRPGLSSTKTLPNRQGQDEPMVDIGYQPTMPKPAVAGTAVAGTSGGRWRQALGWLTSLMPERGSLTGEGDGRMPGMMPQRPAAPQRRQRTWLDLIPQAMAGVADALAMRPTGWGQTPPQRTNYLGQVLGMQEGMRGQEYEDKLREAALEYENQKMGKEDEWRRWQAGQGVKERRFQRKTTGEAMDLRRRGVQAAEDTAKFEEGQLTTLQGLEKTKQGQMRTALLTMYNDELKYAKTPEEAKAV